MKTTANRYHDISCGHRVVGHESKCRHLHGHNYRVHFFCEANSLDDLGRVIDFSVIKSQLCMWLEDNWDHKFLHWEDDQLLINLSEASCKGPEDCCEIFDESLVALPFNPTAENMAEYLLTVVGPLQLRGYYVNLVKVVIEETRKCSVTAEKS